MGNLKIIKFFGQPYLINRIEPTNIFEYIIPKHSYHFQGVRANLPHYGQLKVLLDHKMNYEFLLEKDKKFGIIILNLIILFCYIQN